MMGNKWFRILVGPAGILVTVSILAAPAFAQTWSNKPASQNSAILSDVPKSDGKVRAPLLNVLFVVGDDPPAYSIIYNAVSMLPEIAMADTFNSFGGTPSLDQLLNYNCVYVWANFPH